MPAARKNKMDIFILSAAFLLLSQHNIGYTTNEPKKINCKNQRCIYPLIKTSIEGICSKRFKPLIIGITNVHIRQYTLVQMNNGSQSLLKRVVKKLENLLSGFLSIEMVRTKKLDMTISGNEKSRNLSQVYD